MKTNIFVMLISPLIFVFGAAITFAHGQRGYNGGTVGQQHWSRPATVPMENTFDPGGYVPPVYTMPHFTTGYVNSRGAYIPGQEIPGGYKPGFYQPGQWQRGSGHRY